jgi:hypothetical protein
MSYTPPPTKVNALIDEVVRATENLALDLDGKMGDHLGELLTLWAKIRDEHDKEVANLTAEVENYKGAIRDWETTGIELRAEIAARDAVISEALASLRNDRLRVDAVGILEGVPMDALNRHVARALDPHDGYGAPWIFYQDGSDQPYIGNVRTPYSTRSQGEWRWGYRADSKSWNDADAAKREKIAIDAIAEFVSHYSAVYRVSSANATMEALYIAITEFGVPFKRIWSDHDPEGDQQTRDSWVKLGLTANNYSREDS